MKSSHLKRYLIPLTITVIGSLIGGLAMKFIDTTIFGPSQVKILPSSQPIKVRLVEEKKSAEQDEDEELLQLKELNKQLAEKHIMSSKTTKQATTLEKESDKAQQQAEEAVQRTEETLQRLRKLEIDY